MILVDTSVWVDYLNVGEAALDRLLNSDLVLCHPLIVGEVAMGNLTNRTFIIEMLCDLPVIDALADEDVLLFVAQEHLGGTGLSYIDAHLLLSTQKSGGASLWTRDKRLQSVAMRLGLGIGFEDRLQ